MTSISLTDARATLPELIDRVIAGEEVTITRHGKPVAVVVRPDTLRVRRGSDAFEAADELRSLLAAVGDKPLPKRGTLTPDRADELTSDVRAGRQRRRG